MTSSNNWNQSDLKLNNNMLRLFTKSANNAFICKSAIQKIQSTIYPNVKNIYTTPVLGLKQNLPKLPVPKLQDTLKKYIQSLLPIVTVEELKYTKCLTEEFGKKGGIGEQLNCLLEKKAECSENWLEEWWITAAYLGYRIPVVVHSSPSLVFPLKQFCSPDDQIDYAARLIIATLKYKAEIDNDKIPLEKMGKDPLDMGQYKKFFGTCRIPKKGVDGLEFNPKSQHIVIACNNHYYSMCPMDEKHNIMSLKQLKEELKCILQSSCDETPPIGILSSNHRDTWANAYQALIKDPANKKSVEIIQTSLFLVCFDKALPDKKEENRLTKANHQCIHGGGSKYNSGNRWFDKTVQFIISEDGIVGLTYEHSPSEGQPIAVMTDFIVDNMPKIQEGGSDVKTAGVNKLQFCVDNEITEAIKHASCAIDELICDFDLECRIFKGFGKNYIKSQKLSPDSFIQMAMQYSYYRLHNKPAPHYESAATRKFIGGRTETIRSCSCESVNFAKAMLECSMKPAEKRALLEAAINGHKKYTIEALNGLGVDRHFLGLKLIAKENNIKLPDFFSDVAFIRSIHFNLTSSQVAVKCQGLMSYGAVQPDGYGICYNPRNDEILFGVGAFNADKSTSACKMAEALEQSFLDMKDVLDKAPKAKL